MASIFFILFNLFVIGYALDGIIWNACFFSLNLYRVLEIMYKARRVEFKIPILEDVYTQLFENVGMSRHDFAQLSNVAVVRSLKANTIYVQQGNAFHDLSLVAAGKMVVYKRDEAIGEDEIINGVYQHEFVESPQYAALMTSRMRGKLHDLQITKSASSNLLATDSPSHGGDGKVSSVPLTEMKNKPKKDASTDKDAKLESIHTIETQEEPPTMSVSVRAEEDCVLVTWPLEKLRDFLTEAPHLKSIMDVIVGADVAMRLLRNDKDVTPAAMHADRVSHVVHRYSHVTERREMEIAAEKEIASFLCDKFEHVFPSRVFAYELIHRGKWQYFRRTGTVVVPEGEEVTHMHLLASGSVRVRQEQKDEDIMTLSKLDFIGSLEYYGTEIADFDEKEKVGRFIATSSYITNEPCLVLSFDARDMRGFLSKKGSNIKTALLTVLLKDVTKKFHLLGKTSPVKAASQPSLDTSPVVMHLENA